jgi:hypothetical protein
MCRHTATPLYTPPAADAPPERRLAYTLRGYGTRVVCSRCGLTGRVRAKGKGISWHYRGSVGWLGRDRLLADAAAWAGEGSTNGEGRR